MEQGVAAKSWRGGDPVRSHTIGDARPTYPKIPYLYHPLTTRYDYEECESEGAEKMMAHLRTLFASSSFPSSSLSATSSSTSFTVKEADDFSYTDPIDGSVSTKQGLYIKFTDGSRVIFRLSGTGSSGATVRLYVEKYSKNPEEYGLDAQEGLKPLIEVALGVSKLKEFTGRDKPDVITVSAPLDCLYRCTLTR
jgi:phosphoglucomutase